MLPRIILHEACQARCDLTCCAIVRHHHAQCAIAADKQGRVDVFGKRPRVDAAVVRHAAEDTLPVAVCIFAVDGGDFGVHGSGTRFRPNPCRKRERIPRQIGCGDAQMVRLRKRCAAAGRGWAVAATRHIGATPRAAVAHIDFHNRSAVARQNRCRVEHAWINLHLIKLACKVNNRA